MTFLQTGQATIDDEFKLRIQACVFKLAQDVINESPGTDNHAKRVDLARRIIRNPALEVGQFIWLAAANPTIAASVEVEGTDIRVKAGDGDLEFVCSQHWDTVSGWGVENFVPLPGSVMLP